MLKSDADIALEAMVASAFIVSRGKSCVCGDRWANAPAAKGCLGTGGCVSGQ